MPARALAVAWLLLCAMTWTRPASGSTEGTDFWACHLENRDNALVVPFGIVVANAGATEANVLVEAATGPLGSVVVPPGATRSFTFPPARQMFGTSLEPNAYHVTSDVPVSVVQFNPLDDPSFVRSYTADASTLLAAPSLGTTYRVMSWPEQQPDDPGGMLRGLIGIVGVSAAPTTVTVTPTGDVLDGFIRATPAGTPVTFTLGRFDVAQLVTSGLGQDLSGSLVESDQPVAVFGGAICARVPDEAGYCDHLEEQIFPLSNWGTRYLLIKSEPRADEPDLYRVIAAEDGTVLTSEPDVTGGSLSLRAGEVHEFRTDLSFELASSRPVLVGQYFVGREYDPAATLGDPSLMLAVPAEQFDDDQVFLTPATYQWDFATLIRRSGHAVSLDGAPVPDVLFTPLGGSGYDYARIPLDDGPHRVTGDEGVGVQVYGFDLDMSYAYFGGLAGTETGTLLRCDPGGPYVTACGAGPIVVDGSGSTGPGPLQYTWSSLTPGVTFADPSSMITEVLGLGPGGATVTLTIRHDASSSSCSVDLPEPVVTPPVPAGISEGAPAEWLRVRKGTPDAARLDLTHEDRAEAGERVNLYAGSIPPTGFAAYDHAPLLCATVPEPQGPGIGLLTFDSVPGISQYFLVSASNCSDESTRGQRSDGVERPDLPTDCGPL